MYDNVDFILSNEVAGNMNFLKELPQYLKITNQGKNEYGEYLSGYLRNMKVKLSAKNLRVCDASICKFYHGNNFKTMNRETTRMVIEEISDLLQLPFNRATVTRIDFATNFNMEYTPKIYYPYLGTAQHYRRHEQPNGIYYMNNRRIMIFYDKIIEQKAKRNPIPPELSDSNLLRFELRYKNRLLEQFNRPHLIAETLYDEGFYNNLVTRWKDEYRKIQKINSELRKIRPTTSTKRLIDNFAFIGIHKHGQQRILNQIEEWRHTSGVSGKQAFDLRQSVRRTSQLSSDYDGQDIISELTRKVMEYDGH